jgi:hypothetical protein
MQAVRFRHGPILIEQKWALNRTFVEKFSRLPHAVPFFGGYEYQLRSVCLDVFDSRLNLSHALNAVWSPRAAQEFQNKGALRQEVRQRETSRPIRGLQRKVGSQRSDCQRIRSIFHVCSTVS